MGVTTEPLYQRLYIDSLHFSLTENDVRQIFEPFGPLDFVNLHKGNKCIFLCFVAYVCINRS